VNIAGSVIAGVDQVASHQGLGRCAAQCFEFAVGSQLMWTPEAGFSQNHSPRAG